jgi:malate synthase
MAKKYIFIGQLSIASELLDFVNNELLPGTGISKKKFWYGLDKWAHELATKNKHLLEFREILQKKIDIWHRNKKGKAINAKKYLNFLKDIGYLKKEGKKFKIQTKNVDNEISTVAGPQLVVPVMNARYALNAANARWGSLYDALYGTDVISESGGAERGKKYNYIRGEKVIAYGRNFLDKNVPLQRGSWKNILSIPKVEKNQIDLKLKNPKQFVGYTKKTNHLSSLLLINNNLHIDIKFDPNRTLGGLKDKSAGGLQDKAAIYDIILESAITTIVDHEDSVAAVDAEDKVLGYQNWLGLMKGSLKTKLKKNGKKFTRKLNSDRYYISSYGKKIRLHARALMLNRNVGHLMTSPSILLKDGSEIPEGIMDAFITSAAALHDFKSKGNSRTNSVYIVKPKMHGPDEVAFTNLIFEKVEKVLDLKKYTIKIVIIYEFIRS